MNMKSRAEVFADKIKTEMENTDYRPVRIDISSQNGTNLINYEANDDFTIYSGYPIKTTEKVKVSNILQLQKEIMKRSKNIRGLLRDYHNDVDRIRITLDLKRGKKSVTEDHTLHYTFDVFKKEEPLPGAQFKLFPRV